jgi:KaiC/GvpD/RAD55 family RecA-like ATPase
MELAAAIAANDDKKQARLVPLYAELRSATELKNRRQVKYERAESIDSLFYEVGEEQRIPLYPARLNDRIGGGALPGHHIGLFGRPEIGKSTVTINLACGLAIKGQQRVLYIGNEDQINILKARAVGRVCGFTSTELEERREEAIRSYTDRGGEERLRFIQMFDGGADDIREPIEEFEPTVIVLDQIRNLASADTDGLTARLEENGQAFRRLLLEYKLIGISVTQAGSSAAGKTWLSTEDLDSSKTGYPGTVDLLIGIGANSEMYSRNQRGLSPCKNKLASGPRAREGLLVDVDYERCVVK